MAQTHTALLDRIKLEAGKHWHHRPWLRRTAARGRIRAAGFHVTGFDVDARKIDAINAGPQLHPGRVASATWRRSSSRGHLARDDRLPPSSRRWTSPTSACRRRCRKTKDPDLSYVVQALEGVAANLRAGQLVILESTTYPGTTDEVALPMLERGGLKVGSRLLPRVLAGARRSGQPDLHDEEHSENRRRLRPGQHGGGGGALRAGRFDTLFRSARRALPRW